MRTVVLYHPQSDHGGIVEDYAHEYKRFRGRDIELISLETREGADMANLYDVVRYPAILVISDDGHLNKVWQGIPLPLMNEIDSYTLNSDTVFAQAQLLSA